jgi:hypothetical protein
MALTQFASLMNYQTGSSIAIKAIRKGAETTDGLDLLKESTNVVIGNARLANGWDSELCVIAKKEFELGMEEIYKLFQTICNDLHNK